MSDAYARAGVDTGAADRAIEALVGVLRTIDTGRARRTVALPGHYAAVVEVAPNLGIAIGTARIGTVTGEAGALTVPPLGVALAPPSPDR